MKSLSLIIPAYNEQEDLELIIKKSVDCLEANFDKYEIIIVNDGSTDNTKAVLDTIAAKYKNIIVLHHSVNKGMGAAIRTGYSKATGDYITFIPADGQIEPQEILKFLPEMEDADIVTSIYSKRPDSIQRLFASKFLRLLLKLTFITPIRLEGNYMFKKEILKEVKPRSDTFFYNLEFMILASKKAFKIKQITIDCSPRISGTSKTFNFTTITKVIFEIMKFRMFTKKFSFKQILLNLWNFLETRGKY